MQRLKPLALLLVAALILGFGTGLPTGLTGKDEYLLGLRIPLEMMQDNHWWVPFIDGEPRLKKPPFIYWLGRASFEAFGPSLLAARGITVAFALLLLGCAIWLGRRIAGSLDTGLLAAAILIGMAGMASESRRMMLDIPVAALSTAAFCLYLRWLQPTNLSPMAEQGRSRTAWFFLAATAILLSAALMTKGPIAMVVFGAGLCALFLVRETRSAMLSRWPSHAALAAAALALPVIWYLQVRSQYGVQFARAAQDELEARQVLSMSADPLIGILTLSLPWSFIALHALWTRRNEPEIRFLALWLAITLLPFFFVRSFERYLIGSLLPLALIAAIHLQSGTPRWTRRLGSVIPAGLALALALLLWRFERGAWPWLLPLIGYFLWSWWRTRFSAFHLTVSAALLWCLGWGLAFPALQVNAVPPDVLALTRDRQVTMFAGPQPALLPILLKRPLHQTSRLVAADVLRGALLTTRLEDVERMKAQLDAMNIAARPLLEYHALTSSGSGIRFARPGSDLDDWKLAWNARSAAPLMSTVRIYEVDR